MQYVECGLDIANCIAYTAFNLL